TLAASVLQSVSSELLLVVALFLQPSLPIVLVPSFSLPPFVFVLLFVALQPLISLLEQPPPLPDAVLPVPVVSTVPLFAVSLLPIASYLLLVFCLRFFSSLPPPISVFALALFGPFLARFSSDLPLLFFSFVPISFQSLKVSFSL